MLQKIKTLLEGADELLNKKLEWSGVEWTGWMDTPQTVVTTRALTVLKIMLRTSLLCFLTRLATDD